MKALVKTCEKHPQITSAVAATGAATLAYLTWKSVNNAQIKQVKWQKIEDLRESEIKYREELHERLACDSEKHQEICKLNFETIKTKLQSGELTALEVVQAYEWMALKATEKTNCVASFIRDAEKRAKKLDEEAAQTGKKLPLFGIPVSVKESFILKGTEATCGLTAQLGKWTEGETAPVIEFLINNGAIPFCKTNIPQAILSFDSRNPIYGITTHPMDSKRSPGGSSSGEGVLLSMNGSILGVGTDIGGSSRIPPAWCGVCGLKPTSQRMISDRGGSETGSQDSNKVLPSDFGTYAFLGRDVATIDCLYRLFYTDETFKKNPEMPPLPFRDLHNDRKLRIGYFQTLPNTVEAVPAVKRGVRIAKDLLEKNGHTLIDFYPPEPRRGYLLLLESLVADGGIEVGELLMNDVEISYPNQHLVAATWPNWFRKLFVFWNRRALGSLPSESILAMVPGQIPHDLNLLWRKIKSYRKMVLNAMEEQNIQVLIGPALACPAPLLDDPREIIGASAYTTIYNVLNWPAGVLPISKVSQADQNAMASYPETDKHHRVIKDSLSTNSVGLPVAVQVASKPFCEEVVLRVMLELENGLHS